MRLTEYFLPTLKETPAEAQIVSHRLMLRAGLVKQASAGIYSWLPFGYKVLKNIMQVVREEQDKSGAQEILMPTLQSADLWRESNRIDAYGPQLLKINDRHNRELVFGPTAEEQVSDIFRDLAKSYRDVPKNLYNIQWKVRDEIRPRFGVMRGREFLMKDAYSFDMDKEGAIRAYHKMFVAYLRTYKRLGLKAIPMQADTGPIGGDLSHEFIILADTGESAVYCHKDYLEMDVPGDDVDYNDDLSPIVDKWTSLYAVTDDKHEEAKEKELGDNLIAARGIEVGHIFYFGTKYSKAMGATVTDKNGKQVELEMGSYGIGVSRLVGAIIEASHDDAGIIWPESIAPFKVGLINLKSGDAEIDAKCDEAYKNLLSAGVEVLYDDRDERAGAKFNNMDLIGLPYQIIMGPKGVAKGVVEFKNRKTGEREEISLDTAIEKLTK
ncbi:MAG: proline--tRNA ligase [Alphaproteobacteria bacterium]|nr:proline--tRNA ligase [Alphaproteobacteria bacterium]